MNSGVLRDAKLSLVSLDSSNDRRMNSGALAAGSPQTGQSRFRMFVARWFISIPSPGQRQKYAGPRMKSRRAAEQVTPEIAGRSDQSNGAPATLTSSVPIRRSTTRRNEATALENGTRVAVTSGN